MISYLSTMNRLLLLLTLVIFTLSNLISQNTEVKNGPVVTHFDNGKKKFEGQFRNDIPYGKFTYYYNTGQVKTELNFFDDGVIAYSINYYTNGKKMAEGKYLNQKKDGLWLYYINEKENAIISKENYKNGVLEGEMITYYPNTLIPAEIVNYHNGLKSGQLLKYFPDSTIMTESYYSEDKPDSLFLHYHPDGRLYIKGYYKMGIQLGNWEYYNEEGEAISEEDFLRQEEVSEIK